MSKTVLIVDDQEDERAIQRAMLEHHGYFVREASNGEDALRQVAQGRPDLLLLDIAMPRMSGLDVCRRLRLDPATADLAVLFYTASPPDDWGEELKDLGSCGVLIKPVNPRTVVAEVEKMIGAATV